MTVTVVTSGGNVVLSGTDTEVNMVISAGPYSWVDLVDIKEGIDILFGVKNPSNPNITIEL